MNDIQLKTCHILVNFISLCNRYNLNWFVDGGTLLGTIRSNSFIEWDDDIDVCMPREDFDALSGIMHKDPHYEDLFWQDPITDSEYFNIHARLRFDGTTAISERELGLNSHKGMFIDIYPIDKIPYDTTNIRNFLYSLRNGAENMHDRQINAYAYAFMQDMLSHQRGRKIGALCFSAYKKYANVAVTKDAYSKYVNASFEYLIVRVPVGYDEILRLWYGDDYMTPRYEQSFHSIFIDSQHDYHAYDDAKTMDDLISIHEHLLSN